MCSWLTTFTYALCLRLTRTAHLHCKQSAYAEEAQGKAHPSNTRSCTCMSMCARIKCAQGARCSGCNGDDAALAGGPRARRSRSTLGSTSLREIYSRLQLAIASIASRTATFRASRNRSGKELAKGRTSDQVAGPVVSPALLPKPDPLGPTHQRYHITHARIPCAISLLHNAELPGRKLPRQACQREMPPPDAPPAESTQHLQGGEFTVTSGCLKMKRRGQQSEVRQEEEERSMTCERRGWKFM